MTNQGPYNQPDLRSLIDQSQDDAFSSLNCCQIGKIASFDASTGTATVTLVNCRAVFNAPPDPSSALPASPGSAVSSTPRLIPYPLLVDVPVFCLYGGTAALTLPIAAGDFCLVVFNDRDLDPWFSKSTEGSPPNSNRMHSLADGIALVGIRPRASPISPWDAVKAQLANNGGLVSVDEKLKLSNAATDMKTLLDGLANVLLSTVQTDGSTPNPASIALINAWKTLVDSLFET